MTLHRVPRGTDPKKRFWSAVEINGRNECWPWTLGRSGAYGVFKLDGQCVNVHRLACFWSHGQPPKIKGSHGTANAMHTCKNKICCNPRHLKWASQKDLVAG